MDTGFAMVGLGLFFLVGLHLFTAGVDAGSPPDRALFIGGHRARGVGIAHFHRVADGSADLDRGLERLSLHGFLERGGCCGERMSVVACGVCCFFRLVVEEFVEAPWRSCALALGKYLLVPGHRRLDHDDQAARCLGRPERCVFWGNYLCRKLVVDEPLQSGNLTMKNFL